MRMFAQALPVIILLSTTSPNAQSAGESIVGPWYTEGCKALFDFFRQDDEYKARLITLGDSGWIDSKNPVDSLKTRKVKGITAVYGLRFDPEKREWLDGKIYNPSNGKTYSCYCWLKNGGAQLVFRGYIGIHLLGGSQTWTREKCAQK